MDKYSAFKSLAFRFDPEFIHEKSLLIASKCPKTAKLFAQDFSSKKYQFQHNGLSWSFPVGLAAGFDKNAEAISFFENIGFGAVEIGTVTNKAQEGNPRPRIFRHPDISSIQNAMGFPGHGSQIVQENLRSSKCKNICVGANIGKNKITSDTDAPSEYAKLYKDFAPLADYIVINISSPNTPGLRSFQDPSKLKDLLIPTLEEKEIFSKPIFVKLAPDLAPDDLVQICELSKELNLSGIIGTNTTSQHNFGKGGLSGDYIRKYALTARKIICETLREDSSQTIIGVGGINSYQDLKEFWRMGGHFTQVYTSFVYQGPKLLHNIAKGIDNDLLQGSYTNLQEMITDLHLS